MIMSDIERLRWLVEHGMVERADLDDTGGDPTEIIENVLTRKDEEAEWFLTHPEHPSNLLPGETDPGDRPPYTPRG